MRHRGANRVVGLATPRRTAPHPSAAERTRRRESAPPVSVYLRAPRSRYCRTKSPRTASRDATEELKLLNHCRKRLDSRTQNDREQTTRYSNMGNGRVADHPDRAQNESTSTGPHPATHGSSPILGLLTSPSTISSSPSGGLPSPSNLSHKPDEHRFATPRREKDAPALDSTSGLKDGHRSTSNVAQARERAGLHDRATRGRHGGAQACLRRGGVVRRLGGRRLDGRRRSGVGGEGQGEALGGFAARLLEPVRGRLGRGRRRVLVPVAVLVSTLGVEGRGKRERTCPRERWQGRLLRTRCRRRRAAGPRTARRRRPRKGRPFVDG